MLSTALRGNVAQDAAGGADPVQVVRFDRAHLGVPLQQQSNLLIVMRGRLRGGDRARATNGERRGHAGEQHEIAHRHHCQRICRQRLMGRAARLVVRCRPRCLVIGQQTLRYRPVLDHDLSPLFCAPHRLRDPKARAGARVESRWRRRWPASSRTPHSSHGSGLRAGAASRATPRGHRYPIAERAQQGAGEHPP